jgi:hypothetical protein
MVRVTRVLLVVLVGCSSDEPRAVDLEGDVDAGPAADANPDLPRDLTPGVYELEWTCVDGCGPLQFPPGSFNRLEVSAGFELRWYVDAAINEQLSPAGLSDSLCVVSAGLEWSSGSTAAIGFCAEVGGPEADVVYTADFGPQPTRTYRVKAIPE